MLKGIATEGVSLAPDLVPKTGNVWDNIVMELDRWGSSGYYASEVVEPKVKEIFPKGTQIFIDHAPGEEVASAKTLVGIFKEDGRVEINDKGKKVVRAPMKFYSDQVEWVRERAEDGAIRLSIRTPVAYEWGTRDGRDGKVITEMGQSFSVDIVSRAGAGGAFGMVIESGQHDQLINTENGGDMPFTQEDAAMFANAMRDVFTEALKPVNDNLTALTTTVAEQGKPTPVVPLKPSEVFTAIEGAKLGERAGNVFSAIAKLPDEKVDKDTLDTLIATESAALTAEADAAAAAAAGGAPGTGNGVGTESDKIVLPKSKGWAVANG